jgi:hypothetical protein
VKLRQLDGQFKESSPQDVDDGEEFYLSPDNHAAVELAARVVALLDSRNESMSAHSSECEADDYDGSMSVSEWLRRKSH